MIMTNRSTTTRPPALRLALRGGFVAALALGLVYCVEQRSPTALGLPRSELSLADVEDIGQLAEYAIVRLDSLLSPTGGEAGWLGRVPRGADDVSVEAVDLRSTSDGGYTVPGLGLILVDYDQRVPYRQHEALWVAIAQRSASDQSAGFLVARQADGGEWTFLDRVPEASSSTLHLISLVPDQR